jgi:hypothetical protein
VQQNEGKTIMAIHQNYLLLFPWEKVACDKAAQAVFDKLKADRVRADGADPAERMVEAIATFIIESRKG